MTTPGAGTDFNLGNATGYVDINSRGVSESLNRAQRDFDNFIQRTGRQMQDWGQHISSFGSNLMLWTAPVGAAVGAGLRSAAAFDDVLVEIQARTGLTADAMDEVRQTALQLGADTVFSSQQAADAFLQLLTAGLDVEAALATLPNVLDAAAAGGIDLGTSADVVTNVMSSFRLEATESQRIIEAMSRAAASSPADMLQIGEAMQEIGGLATSMGISLEETASILAIFAQNGIRGAEAGTQMRSLLLNMVRDTPAVTRAWDDLGVSLYDSSGQMRDMDTVFREISAAMADMPMEQQNRIAKDLAGSYGIVGFNALIGSDGIAAMNEQMDAQASASEVADARMDTFSGTVNSLMGSVQTFSVTVLTPFMNDVLKPMAAALIPIINSVTAWAQANPQLVTQIMTFIGLFLALGPALFVVGKAISIVGAAFTALASPIGWAGIAISGLMLMYRENFLGFADFINGVFGQVSGFISTSVDQVRAFISIFRSSLNTGMSPLAALRHAVAMTFGQDALGRLNGFIEMVGDVIAWLQSLWTQVQPYLVQLKDWFLDTALPGAMNFVQGTVIPIISTVIGWLQNLWRDVSPFLMQLADWFLTTILPTIVAHLTNVVIPAIVDIINILKDIWLAVQPYLAQLYDWFMTSALPLIMDFIEGPVTIAINGFVALLSGIWSLVRVPLNFLKDNIDRIFGVIRDIVSGVADAISTAWNAFTRLRDEWNGWQNTAQNANTVFTNVASGEWDAGRAAQLGWESLQRQFGWRDSGGAGQAGMPYMIGTGAQPELFIPQTDGMFIPNADQLGTTYNLSGVTIVANNPQEFERELANLVREDGGF